MQFSRKAPNLERLNENKNTNLKFTIKKQDGLDFSDSEWTPMASCAHDNESSYSVKWWECLGWDDASVSRKSFRH